MKKNSRLKFYMNNPCIVIRDIDDFCEVKINPQFTMGFDGEQWCHACQVGGGPNIPVLDHVCDEYQEVIDVINEESAAIIVMVEKRLLHDQPVEQKEYAEAKKRIDSSKAIYQEYSSSVIELKGEKRSLDDQVADLERRMEKINYEIDLREKKIEELGDKLHDRTVELAKIDSPGDCEIDMYLLLKDSYILSCLESKGVDNWTFFDEAIPSEEEIDRHVRTMMNS